MPAVSELGVDYASVSAWWTAEKDNDYSGAGPILEIPAGTVDTLTADFQFRNGTASQFTIRAKTGSEFAGDASNESVIAVWDCAGYALDFRNDNITIENIYVKNFTWAATGDTYDSALFSGCLLTGWFSIRDFAATTTGVTFSDSIIYNHSASTGQGESPIYTRDSVPITIDTCTIIDDAAGSTYGAIRHRSTGALNISDTVVIGVNNSSYVTVDTPSTPTASNNAASDALLPGQVIDNLTTAIFEDFASLDLRIKSTSSPAQLATPAGAFISAADTTAPTFSAGPTATNQTQSGHDITATLDEDGTIYAVRLADGATAPSSAQVKAGQDSTGSAAPEAKSVVASSGVGASMTFSTGSASTAYDYYVVAEDDEGTPNIQASPTLVNATTAAPPFGIDSTDASMQRDTDFQLVISNPATTPTTGNTTLANGGDTLTASAVTGSDPYTITFPVGDLSKQVDATGYDWTLTVDAETDTTGNTPLVIQSGWTKVDLIDPSTAEGSLLFGSTGDAPVTNDDLEYDVTSTLDSGVSFSVAANGEWTVTEQNDGDWTTSITIDRRVVQQNGTIGSTATMTLVALSIVDIDGDNDIYPSQSNVTINGSGLPTSVINWSASLGGQPLTTVDWNSGNPIVTIPADINLTTGTTYTLSLTYTAAI